MLSQLIYASDATQRGTETAPTILQHARRSNEARDLTGVLVFDGARFMQVLEGSREDVTATFSRIALDERHTNLTLTSVCDIDERDFPDWTMGFLGGTAVTKDILYRYLPAGDFRPRDLSAAAATSMLRVLRDLECTA